MSNERASRWPAWVVTVAILAAGGLGFGLLQVLAPSPSQADTSVPPPPLVDVAPPVGVDDVVVPVEGHGTVRPRIQVQIAARVDGQVEHVARGLVAGRRVEQGAVLVRLDTQDARNQLRQARASLAQREVEALVASSEQDAAQRTAETLAGTGLDLPAEDTPARDLISRIPQTEAAEAALEGARAQVSAARLRLGRTEIVAPFTGVVRSVAVGEGSYVSPGQPVVTLVPADYAEVEVMLTEAEAARIPHLYALARPLAATPPLAEVRRPGTEGTHQGYVDRAELALDAETRTVVVVVRVPDPFGTTQGPPLLLGQYVTVEIEGPKLASAWRIPAAAIRHGPPDADAVWQVDEDQALARVPVDIAHRGTDEAWVTGELREDRPVVIGALQTAVEGMKVRPREADATEQATL